MAGRTRELWQPDIKLLFVGSSSWGARGGIKYLNIAFQRKRIPEQGDGPDHATAVRKTRMEFGEAGVKKYNNIDGSLIWKRHSRQRAGYLTSKRDLSSLHNHV